MKTITLKNNFLSFLLIICCLVNGISQQTYEWGNNRKAYFSSSINASPISVKLEKKSLTSLKYLSRVGGVAFGDTAIPSLFLREVSIKIDYDTSNEDGYRLRLIYDGDTIHPFLPDWQLIPIANFADDTINSCVSILDSNNTSIYGYQISYHNDFINTLLGLRLLQADLSLLDLRSYWELPQVDNKIKLGFGEANTIKPNSLIVSTELNMILESEEIKSWVLTDAEEGIIFTINNGELKFQGDPYFYFWKFTDYYKLYILNIKLQYYERIAFYEEIESKAQQENNEALIDSIKTERALDSLDVKEYISSFENKIEQSFNAINPLKFRYNIFLQYNQAVFDAARNTSHYSALFRYLKWQFPQQWDSFLKDINSVSIAPQVITPNYLPK